ncbi:hypothetical protein [Botrimarina sp.]|uniref:hypothetical protein n=1 Tax=Botrimarina sp. TaxID=2795802 RepID=UPI0032EE074C
MAAYLAVAISFPLLHSSATALQLVDVREAPGLNSPSLEAPSWVSEDGLYAVIESTRSSGSSTLYDLFEAERYSIDEPFSTPSQGDFRDINLVPRNAGFAVVSSDELELFYGQEIVANSVGIPVTGTTGNMYRSVRDTVDEAWPVGTRQSAIHSLGDHIRPLALSTDGLRLYLSVGPPPARQTPDWDLWVVSRSSTQDEFLPSNAEVLASLNSDASESELTISSDETTVIISSSRPGVGGADLWYSTRDSIDDAFSPPSLLPGANTSFSDRRPVLAGSQLFFSSTRSGEQQIYVGTLIPEPGSLGIAVCGVIAAQLLGVRRSRSKINP